MWLQYPVSVAVHAALTRIWYCTCAPRWCVASCHHFSHPCLLLLFSLIPTSLSSPLLHWHILCSLSSGISLVHYLVRETVRNCGLSLSRWTSYSFKDIWEYFPSPRVITVGHISLFSFLWTWVLHSFQAYVCLFAFFPRAQCYPYRTVVHAGNHA